MVRTMEDSGRTPAHSSSRRPRAHASLLLACVALGGCCATWKDATTEETGMTGSTGMVPLETKAGEPVSIRPTKAFGMMFNIPPEGTDPSDPTLPAPGFFVRAGGAIAANGQPIEIPAALDTILYEGELVIVIGERARRVSEADAGRCISGYTCGMDGSPLVVDADGERDAARSIAGKSVDGIAPVGPVLVRELRPEGQDIILRVNGEEVERVSTAAHIWSPQRIVAEISRTVTLEPGDVIFAGARKAVPKMTPGDVVEVEIEGIGVLRNEVVAAPAATP